MAIAPTTIACGSTVPESPPIASPWSVVSAATEPQSRSLAAG
jgi:hypothetical protein